MFRDDIKKLIEAGKHSEESAILVTVYLAQRFPPLAPMLLDGDRLLSPEHQVDPELITDFMTLVSQALEE